MYNRYIPQDTSYTRLETEQDRTFHSEKEEMRGTGPTAGRMFGALGSLRNLFSAQNGEHRTLSSVIKSLDSGDVLLLLIAILLLVEGEDADLAVALGLVFLLGLGDESEKHEK